MLFGELILLGASVKHVFGKTIPCSPRASPELEPGGEVFCFLFFFPISFDILSYFKMPLPPPFSDRLIYIQSLPVKTVLFGMNKYGIISLKTILLITGVGLLYLLSLHSQGA